MNWIENKQNSPEMIQLIAASSDRYRKAKLLLATQVILGVLIPVLLSSAKFLEPQLASWAALYGLLLAIADIFLFESVIKKLMKQGALAQECFDCSVLSLKWNEFEIDKPLTHTDTIEWSKSYMNTHPDESKMRDWYPVSAGTIPVDYGRLICQLSNCLWDAQLRKRYAASLLITVAIIVISIVFISMALNATVESLVLTISALLPAIIWLLKGRKAQNETIKESQRQKDFIEKLWSASIGGDDSNGLIETARSIQDSIFRRRMNSQPVFNWIYRFFRSKDQINMKDVAEAMTREYNSKLNK
jgi:hypothetical protein